QKIRSALYRHGLSDYVLRKAFEEIDDAAYDQTLDELLERKYLETKESNAFRKKGRVARWLISRGYEPDIVWDKLKALDA
ncbi:MAG: regulatory protein RecX, partial [Owenweeksia sp.]